LTDAATNTGKQLELEVANAYRRLGAHKVECDVEMAGNPAGKLDPRMPTPLHLDAMVTEAHVRGRAQIPLSPGNAFLLSRAGYLQYNSPQAASRLSVQPAENPPQALHYEHTE